VTLNAQTGSFVRGSERIAAYQINIRMAGWTSRANHVRWRCSLADDSVLERLNSVLEPSHIVVLAERGGDDLEHPTIRAVDSFKLVATMNPGGYYGKKELSLLFAIVLQRSGYLPLMTDPILS
jgi:hypothetical protein